MKNMRHLIDTLNRYRHAYYNENQSLVSDKEYDRLYDQLVILEEDTGVIYPDSPTQTVGYPVISKLTKVKHNHPLLSLGKTTDIEEFANYFEGKLAVVMAKMDGLTCSLLYRNGELVIAETRGNGEIGEDVTHNARTIKNLPQKIPYDGELIVDGEVIITTNDFEEINRPLVEKATKEAEEKGFTGTEYTDYIRKHTYANPRNLASGSIRQLDSKVAAERKLKFVAWKLYRAIDKDGIPNDAAQTMRGGLLFLQNCGFEIVPFTSCAFIQKETLSERYEVAIDFIRQNCYTHGYPIDGCTAAFDNIAYGESLGMTGHHPKHTLAYKFYQEGNETILRDIEWSTSRTGLVNPVAIFDPVEIDGTTVSRASLSNVSIIKELELGIGDTVSVIKANQIIPQLTDNLTRSNTYELPTICPSCGENLTLHAENDRETLVCENLHCTAQINDRIANFASRAGMDIEGLSEKRIRILLDKGYISNFVCLYTLHNFREELEALDGFGKSSVDNLLSAIERSRTCRLENVLVALGIPNIGKSTAKTIANYCLTQNTDIPNLLFRFIEMCLCKHDWSVIDGIGKPTSDEINKCVQANKLEFSQLATYLVIESPEAGQSSNLFGGKTFCITGKLEIYPNRDALVSEIEKLGGKIVSGVTAKTDYLITNDPDSGSGKAEKAKKFGTKILTEQEFINLRGAAD